MCGFIKEWIENWKEDQKINSEIENPGNMSDLLKIVAMKDPEYVKEFIEYNEEILEECRINGDSAVELIKTVEEKEPGYIKELLENVEKMRALGIYDDRAVELIKAVGDPEYIKECLENVEKMRALGIYDDRAVELIKAVGDPEYIKECLGNVEKMNALGIDFNRAVELIKAVGDPEYMKEYLGDPEKREALHIYGDRAIDLIKTVGDPEYIKECLENIEKMQALGINGDRVVDLIKTVGDPEYIKECLENVEKMQTLGIWGDRAVELIKAVGDSEYIKECLGNVEKMQALDIKDDRAYDLIKTVEEKEPGYIKEFLENVKKVQVIRNGERVVDLIKATGDPEYIKETWIENVACRQELRRQNIFLDEAELIKTVEEKEPGYIKELLENLEKMKALEIYDAAAVELIKTVEEKEPGYIKELLENVEKMKALEIYDAAAVELIKTVEEKEPGYIKELLENVEKMKALKIYVNRVVELIKTVGDPEYIKECLENVEKMQAFGINGDKAVELIKAVGDPEYIKECLENVEKMQAFGINDYIAVKLIKTVGDPEYIKECLENVEKMKALKIYDDAAVELIKTVEEKEPGYIKECLENVEKMKALEIYVNRVVELIKTVGDPEYIKECLENVEKMQAFGINDYIAVELIKTVGDPEYIKECLENVEKMQAFGINGDKAVELIKTVGDPEYIKECLGDPEKMEALGIYGNIAVELIKTVEEKEPGYIKELLESEEKMQELGIDDYGVIELIKIVNKKEPEFLIEYIKNKEKWKLNESTISLLKQENETEFIKENLEIFFKGYGFEEKDISSKAEILEQMHEINDEVYQKLDFRLLDNKYLKLLGQDKINQISCYPEVQELVLKLNEKKLKVLAKCIDTYMHNNDTEEWTVITNEILNNISCGQYDELIENIDNLDNADINKLIKVLQAKNAFEIKCEKDLENFELIKQQRCDKLIQSSEIGDKKLAVLEKLFGTDDGYAEILLRRYGQGIDSLPESEAKNFIKSIQMLVNCQSGEILEQIYNECEETVFIDKVGIERALKKEYAKLYNEGLFKIENAVPIGENMYSAGTDFKMIITSIGAFSREKRQSNYKNDWNRPRISTQHLCTSYIRQDMMGTAPIHDICYGFDCMREDSLVLSGTSDIYSSKGSMVSTCRHGEEYLVPDEQINHTYRYNEMCFRRIQGVEKKQPSYIVVFKQNGIIGNLENAEKASKDWGGLPIVVIDRDECLESERNKVKQMQAEYREFPSPELARAIYYKIRNNRVTARNFCWETNISRYEINEQAVSKRELAENSNEVSGEDRRDCMAKIRTAIEKVKGDGEVER